MFLKVTSSVLGSVKLLPKKTKKDTKKPKRGKKKEKILIIGVGNTCGIGNSKKELVGLEKKLKSHREKTQEKKKKGLFK